ncbi:hypothetical protein Y1Q_0012491 [Alligator mississippiensis]|uniref:Uncharacterized protein n=1 Tax=Alligator mississippiensis TaxID=8496 RepID=A0A151M7U1_ALLMI|nr:hypothetical protein Y1Q_0012491 [Alligator mississippiensis]
MCRPSNSPALKGKSFMRLLKGLIHSWISPADKIPASPTTLLERLLRKLRDWQVVVVKMEKLCTEKK